MNILDILNEETKDPAVVIAGFPGIGKSYFKKKQNSKVLDSDSSKFSWKDSKQEERNPDFPKNYIEHIKSNLDKADIILVSTHDEVRKALEDNDIKYKLVFPDIKLKKDYMKRYEERGNDAKFIKFISDGWDKMIKNLQKEEFPEKIILKKDEFLSDAIKEIDKP